MTHKQEPFILLLGDIAILVFSLWAALALRLFELPAGEQFVMHLEQFAIIFVAWVLTYFIGGLYEKHTLLFKSRLPQVILRIQLINAVISTALFYLLPFFAITPKTILFIWLVISSAGLLLWRLYGTGLFVSRQMQKAFLIASGAEMKEIHEEINNNPRYGLQFVSMVDLDKLEGVDFKDEVLDVVYGEEVSTIVVDLRNENVREILPHLYNLIYSHVQFVDMYKLYEDIFDRVPLSLVNYNWFLENISSTSHLAYDILKRSMDIVIALLLLIPALFVLPLVMLAIKLDDKGEIFNVQERVGRNNGRIKLLKLRTMSFNDGGKWGGEKENKVTRVGAFLRRARIDEFPQLWNVLRGDISLIGPRPEFPEPVAEYEKQVPYYGIRHLIKPGLSGWAQLYHENHPHHGVDVKETEMKLSYDLYYIKNRSFLLDLKIALKTVKTLLSRSGV